MKTVWVTRTQPGAEATAERVRAAGFHSLIAPLLEVAFESAAPIDLTGITTLAFTSANGVRAFAARSATRDRPVFAVGRGTAKAARASGFAAVTSSDGDVLALARVIPRGETVLHAGAAEPAADLVLALTRRGVAARGVVVYRTVSADLSKADLAAASAADFVLLQSAKAARAFRALHLRGPRLVCQSAAVAGDSVDATIAAEPTEDALIAALLEAAR